LRDIDKGLGGFGKFASSNGSENKSREANRARIRKIKGRGGPLTSSDSNGNINEFKTNS
jgi:hypothetical protein